MAAVGRIGRAALRRVKPAGRATAAPATKAPATKAPAKKAAVKKAAVKKAPAKKAAVKKAAVKKVAAKKAAVKKVAAKKAPAKNIAAKKAPAKKVAAKKVAAAKAPAKKAAAKKVVAKTVVAEKVAAKKAPATKVAAKTAPAKTAPAKTAPAKAAPIVPAQSPWTKAELKAIRTQLVDELTEIHSAYEISLRDLDDLQRSSTDGAGDDQADAGSKTFDREQEQSIAGNRLDLMNQMQHAVDRIDAGTYGFCERCGKPIPKARLQAFPAATLDVACKTREERR